MGEGDGGERARHLAVHQSGLTLHEATRVRQGRQHLLGRGVYWGSWFRSLRDLESCRNRPNPGAGQGARFSQRNGQRGCPGTGFQRGDETDQRRRLYRASSEYEGPPTRHGARGSRRNRALPLLPGERFYQWANPCRRRGSRDELVSVCSGVEVPRPEPPAPARIALVSSTQRRLRVLVLLQARSRDAATTAVRAKDEAKLCR